MLKNIPIYFRKFNNLNLQISKTTANLIIGILILCGISLIVWNANWTFGDDSQFLLTTAVGKPIFGWSGAGRFWPLGLADYNILLILPFGDTPIAHFIWNSVLFLIGMLSLFKFLTEVTEKDYFVSIISIFILIFSAAFLEVNITLPTAERIIWVMSAVFMLCVWKAEKKQSTKYYIIALLVAAYTTYTKEPVFVMFLIIAFTRLLFGFRQLTKKDKLFYYGLIVVALSYLITYAYLWFQNPPNCTYNMGQSELRGLELVLELLNCEPILCGTIILCLVRFLSIIFLKDKEILFTDCLLFAGGGYFLAIFYLNLIYSYYIVPCVFFSIPAFACFLHSLRRYNFLIFLSAIFLLLLPLYKDFHSSIFTVERMYTKRQNDMRVINYLYEQSKLGKRVIWVLFDNAFPDPIGGRICSFFNWNFFVNFLYKEDVNIVVPVNNLDVADENTIIIFSVIGQNINYLLSHEKMQNYYLKWHCPDAYTEIYAPKTDTMR